MDKVSWQIINKRGAKILRFWLFVIECLLKAKIIEKTSLQKKSMFVSEKSLVERGDV